MISPSFGHILDHQQENGWLWEKLGFIFSREVISLSGILSGFPLLTGRIFQKHLKNGFSVQSCFSRRKISLSNFQLKGLKSWEDDSSSLTLECGVQSELFVFESSQSPFFLFCYRKVFCVARIILPFFGSGENFLRQLTISL